LFYFHLWYFWSKKLFGFKILQIKLFTFDCLDTNSGLKGKKMSKVCLVYLYKINLGEVLAWKKKFVYLICKLVVYLSNTLAQNFKFCFVCIQLNGHSDASLCMCLCENCALPFYKESFIIAVAIWYVLPNSLARLFYGVFFPIAFAFTSSNNNIKNTWVEQGSPFRENNFFLVEQHSDKNFLQTN
jgi:hypothetical protein